MAEAIHRSPSFRRLPFRAFPPEAGHRSLETYAASSAVYLGQRRAGTLRLLPDGTVFSARAMSKIRLGERGWRYAVEQLVAAGAAEPQGDNLDAWLTIEAPRVLRRTRHPGCLKYAIPFTRAVARALPASRPFPRVSIPGCEPFAVRCA